MDRATKVRVVEWAMRASGGHVGRAAQRIGAHRNTVAAVLADALMFRGRIGRGQERAARVEKLKGCS